MALFQNGAMPANDRRRRNSAAWLSLTACILAALACNLPTATSVPTATALPLPTPIVLTASPGPSPTLPYPDANTVLAGVCFAFLQTLGGQTIILDSPRDLSQFYDQVDSSKRCKGAVERQAFDFSDRQIVGTVITGAGCAIGANYDRTAQDDAVKQRTIVFQVYVSGDCPYDLVRPLWLAVARPPAGYSTQFQISKSP
jgi:hypothetical protein